ncbi:MULTISPECIES: tyrosine-type recombinase/integrase [unclassified Burkholderia]|uniref:tyrosine-type recombinase/integrase n=1 Tax=unclassified Burkholderia TaxID=2613784 RepID=UPI002AAF6699|nr:MULTISPECIES: tyrosine-type recombinase/integrase [unclassified Burkholderia]
MRIPRTKSAQDKHAANGHLIEWVRKRLILELDGIEAGTRTSLARLSPHTFRHTIGTQAVAHDVALDVVQKVPGHASLRTTSIYVQAEQKRVVTEVSRYFGRGRPTTSE